MNDRASPPLLSDEASTIEVLERELARAYRIERALRDVGLAIGTTLDLDALLRLILERTIEALEAERATLYLLEQKPTDEGRGETILVSRVVEGGAVDEISLRMGEGIAGEVARTGHVANVRDAYADPRFSRAWDERSGFRTKAVLCVPLRSQLGRITGVIQVLNKRAETDDGPGYFDEDDEALLAALATQAAVSIEQARLFVSILDKNRELSQARAALEKKVQDLQVLFAIERATSHAITREELAAAILPEAARALAARTAYVVLADDAGDLSLMHLGADLDAGPTSHPLDPVEMVVRPSISAPPPQRTLSRMRIKGGEGLVGTAMSRNEPIIVDDVSADSRSSARILRALFPHGDDHGLRALVVPLTDERDAPIGALGVVRPRDADTFSNDDVDLLRLLALNASTGFQLQAARELRVREERLSTIGSLLSGVMHDLKTPMTVIGGFVQMMGTENDEQQRGELAERVMRQIEHISAMQKEVLDFARGERTMLVRKVYLAKFFGEIEAQLRREIERRQLPIELSLTMHDRGTARFDEGKVTRALHNLARNAIEAMGEQGGKLALAVERGSGGEVAISVSDTGPGLPREVQERLFQSFVTAGKPTGTGLGLAIVKRIVDDHGGSITATTSDVGTTFRFTLPQPVSQATAVVRAS